MLAYVVQACCFVRQPHKTPHPMLRLLSNNIDTNAVLLQIN